ncbi:MAG TPA: riboflavin synthase [Longimicrobiales bacterium]
MFTGIVEEVGTVRRVARVDNGVRLAIAAARVLEDLSPGDSVALDGVCQTVVSLDETGFEVVAIGTTLSRTTLGEFEPGRAVNLERALAFGGRIGGHLVQGHVDGVGEVVALERRGEHRLIDIRLPDEVAEVTVLHGSITVNGVSMTVNALPGRDVAQIAVIPYTWEHTTLSALAVGRRVNLEGDLLGRFVTHYLKRTGAARVVE